MVTPEPARPERLATAIQSLRHDPDTPTLEEHVRHGLPVLVHNSRPDISTPSALDRLDSALALIDRYTPDRFARLGMDFVAILVRRYACRAAYYPDLGVCLIELTFLVHPDITPAQVGASIVHEAVHARLGAAGIKDGRKTAAADEEVAPTIDWRLAAERVAQVDERDRWRSDGRSR